ncbi:hypothetical protein TNCV_4432781 [Trichonephila clavipes]|nr:hypothetical protein TNCV_4432781 [Trichonephila clavipes]
MSFSGGQSEAKPPVFKSPSKLGTHLSTYGNLKYIAPTLRAFSGTRFELMIRQPRVRYLDRKATAATRYSGNLNVVMIEKPLNWTRKDAHTSE